MGNCSEEKPGSCIPANTVYGPYMIYPDATIIDIGKKKKIKKVLRNGKYYVGLRLQNEENLRYYSLYRILYEAFVDPSIGAQDYIIPADGDYKNLDISNLKKVSASEFHKVHPSGRKKKITKKEYEEICDLSKNGLSYRAIAGKYSVSHYVIQKLLRNGFYTKGD